MFSWLEVVQACRSLLLPIVEKLIVVDRWELLRLETDVPWCVYRRGLATGTTDKTLSGPSTEDTIPGNMYKESVMETGLFVYRRLLY